MFMIGKNNRNRSRYFFLKSSFLKIKNNGNVINIIGFIMFLIAKVPLRKRLTRYKDDPDAKNIITLE
tara:strand:- start:355 stop:555 length:201 start_codon:yes stop_codon:yes gene_type:complete